MNLKNLDDFYNRINNLLEKSKKEIISKNKVKILINHNYEDLENKINDFLEKNAKIEVCDIKLRINPGYVLFENRPPEVCHNYVEYSCLISYIEKL